MFAHTVHRVQNANRAELETIKRLYFESVLGANFKYSILTINRFYTVHTMRQSDDFVNDSIITIVITKGLNESNPFL